MFIASQKRKENYAEYVLYMWHIENIIRACNLEIEKIKTVMIDKFDLDDEKKKQMIEWYESLIDMMKRENVVENGHIQIVKNSITALADLHHKLLQDPHFAEYGAEITPQTSAAISHISEFIALLSHYYKLDQEDKLFKDQD